MTKSKVSYLTLVVDNGKLINQAYELAKEQQELIMQKIALQDQIDSLVKTDKELGNKITKIEKQIDKLERKVNGKNTRLCESNNGENS